MTYFISAPRQCIICGLPATVECVDCFGEHGGGLDSTAFCEQCLASSHAHAKRREHRPQRLNLPPEYYNER